MSSWFSFTFPLFHPAHTSPVFFFTCSLSLPSLLPLLFHPAPSDGYDYVFFHKRVIKLTRVKMSTPGGGDCRGYWQTQYNKISYVYIERNSLLIFSSIHVLQWLFVCTSGGKTRPVRMEIHPAKSMPAPSCLCCSNQTLLQDSFSYLLFMQ